MHSSNQIDVYVSPMFDGVITLAGRVSISSSWKVIESECEMGEF
jgi:hypothetical protein